MCAPENGSHALLRLSVLTVKVSDIGGGYCDNLLASIVPHGVSATKNIIPHPHSTAPKE